MKTRTCPCGCGEILKPYNGVTPLVCFSTWQRVPREARARFMLPSGDKRAMARVILLEAIARRKERMGGK